MINPQIEKKKSKIYDLYSDCNISKSANCSGNLDVKYINQQIVWIVGGLPNALFLSRKRSPNGFKENNHIKHCQFKTKSGCCADGYHCTFAMK